MASQKKRLPASRRRATEKKPAGRVADIRTVAAQAGVSISTVSRYMNGKPIRKEAEVRVAAAVRALGYRPNRLASSLKSNRTHTLAMLLPDIANPFFPEVVKGAEAAARAAGYHLILADTGGSPAEEWARLESMRALQCDGVLIAPLSEDPTPQDQARFAALHMPVVFFDRRPGFTADLVTSDNVRAAEEAVSHLIRLGHRRIGIVHPRSQASPHLERVQGYRNALRAAGLTCDPDLEVEVPAHEGDGAPAVMRRLGVAAGRPSALFITSNRLTIGAMGAIFSGGLRCPEDVAVVGYDDYPWANAFRPRLTTVAQPGRAIGEKATALLIARLSGSDGPPEEIVMRAQLVVRESCGVYQRR